MHIYPDGAGEGADELRRQLDLDRPDRPVLSDRSLDADERRLLADVPPHHGH